MKIYESAETEAETIDGTSAVRCTGLSIGVHTKLSRGMFGRTAEKIDTFDSRRSSWRTYS